jgi:predicted GH43/DUF377 family glycosyl hydrolase
MILFVLTAGTVLPFASAEGQWIRFSGNPIIPTPSWAPAGVIRPRVLFDGSRFKMWFSALKSSGNPLGIGYASSVNGFSWIVNPDPVLLAKSNNWEDSEISLGSVIWTGTDFMMWYRGGGQSGSGAVGLATSQDGINWIKYSGNPVMTNSSVDSDFLSTPYVVQTGSNRFRMWYTCQTPSLAQFAICTASSADGKTWTKSTSPVLTSDTGKWDASDLYSPSVIFDGSMYGIWYTSGPAYGMGAKIGYATSKHGIALTKDANNPILSVGSSGAWDAGGVENQCVVQSQGGYLLYYDGYGTGQTSLNYIGVAQSPASFTLPEMTLPVLAIALTMMLSLCIVKYRRPR